MRGDEVNDAVSAAAAAVAAAVKMCEDGSVIQASRGTSRGTVAWSDSLYDDEEDRRYSRLGHSASYDDGP